MIRPLNIREIEAVCGGVTEGGCVPDFPVPIVPQLPTVQDVIKGLQ
jgi:hypothetical protein